LTRIQIPADSELARFLDKVGTTPVLLEKNGKLYRLTEETQTNPWAGYDPQKTKAALRNSAGAFHGIDREALLTDMHKGRAQDSLGRPVDD
jgi:hypothetical protein